MEISGPQPDKPSYPLEFEKSVDLFEKSFKELETSKLPPQRDHYIHVMQQTLHTMQEAASGMLNQHLIALKENLSNDLESYLAAPTDEHRQKVESDIQSLKNEEQA